MRYFGVFLSYYPDPKGDTIKAYQKAINFIAKKEVKLIVVNNSNNELPVDNIEGDNSSWEFSGFQKGVEHLKAQFSLSKSDIIFFGNDTFSSHRVFSLLDLICYRKKLFGNLSNEKPMLIGEKLPLSEPAQINGLILSSWVSTYFFITNGHFLLGDCDFAYFGPNSKINLVEKKLNFYGALDNELSKHINSWLFPEPGKHGWYGSKQASDELLINKARAILNEKYLSAQCEYNGGVTLNVYTGIVGKITHYLNYNVFSRHKRK